MIYVALNFRVNDYIDTMTNWHPSLEQAAGPRYRAIARAIADDVAEGRLPPGTRLPPHRELAYRLGVTVGTVSRAYAEAGRRGLLVGEVGRGTYIRETPVPRGIPIFPVQGSDTIDLSANKPVEIGQSALLARSLHEIADDPALGELLGYQPHEGVWSHREAAAGWLAPTVPGASPERVVITAGAQHGLMTVLAALTEPGDVILSEALTWAGIKALAGLLHFRIEGLAGDDRGILPDAFEAACRQHAPKALALLPTLHNPTMRTMPLGRREAIVEIARRHDVSLVEDNLYGFLADEAPPAMAALAPERTYYIDGASKCMAPGLRTGFVLAPEGRLEEVAANVHTSLYMTTPLTAEITARWIREGHAERLMRGQRDAVEARHVLARNLMGSHYPGELRRPLHLWLELPEPWRSHDFVAAARRRGVAVTPADVFAVGRASAPHAVRLALGAPRSEAVLARGLTIVRELLDAAPPPRLDLL